METSAPLSADLELRLSTRDDGSLHLSAVHEGGCVASEAIIPPNGIRAEMASFTAIRRVLLSVASGCTVERARRIPLPSGSTLFIFENYLALNDAEGMQMRQWRAADFQQCPGITTFDLLYTLDLAATRRTSADFVSAA